MNTKNVKPCACSAEVAYSSYVNGHCIVIYEVKHELFGTGYLVQDLIPIPKETIDENGNRIFVSDIAVIRTSREYKTIQETFKEFNELNSLYAFSAFKDADIDTDNKLPLHGSLADTYFNTEINNVVNIGNIKLIEQVSEEAFDPYNCQVQYDFDMTIKDTKFNCHATIDTGSYSSNQIDPEINISIDDPNTGNPNAGAYADFNFAIGVDEDYVGVEYSRIIPMNYADSLKHIDNNMLNIEEVFRVPIKAIGAKCMKDILGVFLHTAQESND